ncbi:MAG: carbohydrate ABC transporter permease [Candidatus Hydrogenedentota bacterium]|nr:MAG: carbohydrate ABC transporter permease [Candidatus Hydrogenedentota bacterium]
MNEEGELHKLEKKIRSIALHLLLLLGAATMLVPFWWMVSTSMTENANSELSNPPRWTPWRSGNRALASASGATVKVLGKKGGETVVALLNDGRRDVAWATRRLQPGETEVLLLDVGISTMFDRVEILFPGNAEKLPKVALDFCVEKGKWDTTARIVALPRELREKRGVFLLAPRVRARFIKMILENPGASPARFFLAEIRAHEQLKPTLANYKEVLKVTERDKEIYGFLGRFGRYYANSVFVAGLLTLTNLFFCSLAGYAFAKGRFLGREFLFYGVLATMMVPGQVTMIPVYKLMTNWKLLDSLWALILPGLTGAYGVFLCTQFIRALPDSLMEAARMDGCSEWRVYWEVIVPLSKPVLATLGILTFLFQFNSFLWPLIMINDEKWKTLPLGLATYRQQYTAEWGNMMAAAAISIIPILIVFIVLQKYVIKSMAHAGMKE